MRITPVETLRTPEQGSSPQGKSGPKARPKGVVDGKQVNIPVLLFKWYRGTKEGTVGQYWLLAETFKVMKDRIKTILELRRDTVLFPV